MSKEALTTCKMHGRQVRDIRKEQGIPQAELAGSEKSCGFWKHQA